MYSPIDNNEINSKKMSKQYYSENIFTKEIPKTRRKIKKNSKFPLKRIILLFICLILLCGILPYSFNAYIRDVFPSKINKYLAVDYNKLMYPAQSMFPDKNLILGKYTLKNVKYDKPIMIDIPESFERIGLKNQLLALSENYKRIYPSIYIWEYNGKSYVDINADEPFPAASIIKIPVLIEMFRDIEHEKFTLFDTMMFEEHYRAEGSGILKHTKEGKSHSLDYLAKTMIENSDNSSTNMIMAKIGGMPEVNIAMRRWGLKKTSINNWLPDMGGTNVTTARELSKMLYNLDITNILSDNSKRHIANYMLNVKNTRLLKAGLPNDAILLHKTGDIGFMLGDAGIVRAANGKKYIVVIMVKRPYNNFQGKEFIVKASAIIYNHIVN